jgi:hypothetical protein
MLAAGHVAKLGPMASSRAVAMVLAVSTAVLLGGCNDAGPAPESPAVASAQTASGQARDAVDQLGAAAEQVANAGSAAELAAGLPPLKAALTATADDLAAYGASLRAVINGGEQAVRSAFGAAPACRHVDPTVTPSRPAL